jgi:lipoprotein-anchoring transpeptidase ErfK/SrfK
LFFLIGAAVFQILSRLMMLAGCLLLAACATPEISVSSQAVPGYEGIQDGEFFIAPVPARYLPDHVRRREVAWVGDELPGDIIVDTHARVLYYMLARDRAMRYTIAVGREGVGFAGNGTIQRKEEWPSWTPTANMVRTRPDLYAAYAGGLPGGLINPLGSRAMYLYRGGRDTYFRIHGTQEVGSIGRATSAGCIRLFNQDAIDLYNRVELGTRVHVRTLQESIQWEGRFVENADGLMVRATEANLAAIQREKAARATTAADTGAAAREALLTGEAQAG